jgi:signal transduction protein with GAF and PtsI domain
VLLESFNARAFPAKFYLPRLLEKMGKLERESCSMPDKEKTKLEEKLRSIIETIDVADALTAPLTVSIENLLKISAAEINSEEASVLVRDGDEGDLRFLSAIGKVAEHLKTLKIPAGKGIAGFVFSSGQPMALNDVSEEDSFYAEVDKQTGYSTQTRLATPLRHEGEVIGVLEYVNRIGEPPYESFTSDEMDKVALFAEAIASLVNAYESAKLFRELGDKMISAPEQLKLEEMREWINDLRETTEHKEMIELALTVRELARRGERERRMCREILESILRHSESDGETSFLSF